MLCLVAGKTGREGMYARLFCKGSFEGLCGGKDTFARKERSVGNETDIGGGDGRRRFVLQRTGPSTSICANDIGWSESSLELEVNEFGIGMSEASSSSSTSVEEGLDLKLPLLLLRSAATASKDLCSGEMFPSSTISLNTLGSLVKAMCIVVQSAISSFEYTLPEYADLKLAHDSTRLETRVIGLGLRMDFSRSFLVKPKSKGCISPDLC